MMAEVTPTTVTKIMADKSRHRLMGAMHHLLWRLKDFIEVRPMMKNDKLPECEVFWLEHVYESGPAKAILDANKSCPLLWRDAIPPDVVMIPRNMLERAGLSADIIEAFAGCGEHAVEAQAAHYKHDLQNAKSR